MTLPMPKQCDNCNALVFDQYIMHNNARLCKKCFEIEYRRGMIEIVKLLKLETFGESAF